MASTEEGSIKSYSKTLEEFRNFRRVGDPFTEDFFELFNSVVSHQFMFLKRLQEIKGDLDNKLHKLKVWRKITGVLFVVASVAVLMFIIIVFLVLGARPVMIGLMAAIGLSVLLIGIIGWRNLALKKKEKDLIAQREIVSSMQFGLYVVARDLDNLKGLTDEFKVLTGFEDLLGNADFAISMGGEAVTMAVEENKKKMDRFIQEIRSLVEMADKCNREAKMARTLLMRKIISYPNS